MTRAAENLDFAELAHANDLRAAQYALLARLFRVEVDAELLAELKAMRFAANTGNALIDEGHCLIVGYLASGVADPLTELAVDYVHAFIGSGNTADSAAYPFESVYTSEKRLLMQGARDEVLAVYRSCGLAKQGTWHEGEDHVALELEFMEVMAKRTAEALRASDEEEAVALLETQRSFLNEHLAAWAPMMTADMRRFVTTDFYRGLASLLEGVLATDSEFLADALVGE